ncbi:dUTP diphosphatase [Cellulomonas sp. GbtcB1]|uniref:dUTP diphosphatase n=1 Tax=unclassified Cellulomonas TaxID=2620175 RepID=UPI0027E1F48A|nr:dUTP diphosphatase [Cellulomonas sp. GbtcB1]
MTDDAPAPVAPETLTIGLRRLDEGVPVPAYAHPGDAGADLVTRVDATIEPGERATLPTGIAIALPEGYAAFVHPRSGLAARHGLTIVNAPGTVDAGYRGEIAVTLLNTDAREPVVLHRGDRVAQLVIQRVERALFVEVDELPDSVRGTGGFGSSGGWRAAGAPTEAAGATTGAPTADTQAAR